MQRNDDERKASMDNPAAKYTDEFRHETANYVISTGRPISECCRELGLNSKTVNQWVIKRRRELSGQPDPKAEFPVYLMARVLEASCSGVYSWLELGCQRDDWAAERGAVMRVWLEFDRRFGFRFVHAMLPPRFIHLTRYRVLKLMREPEMRGCALSARERTAVPDPKAKSRGYVAGNAIFHSASGAPSTPAGPWPSGRGPTTCAFPAAAPATAATTPWPSRSSPR